MGVTSDSQEQLHTFQRTHAQPFTMLSDPTLISAEHLNLPVSTQKTYWSTLAIHPVLRHLPNKAFLQPAVLLWSGTELVYQWHQVEKLRNLFGANGRPSPEQILDLTRNSLS